MNDEKNMTTNTTNNGDINDINNGNDKGPKPAANKKR